MSIESIYNEARGATRDPEGLSVFVVTKDPELAVRAAAHLAAILHPGRRFGPVLHVGEPETITAIGIEVVVQDLGPRR
jgi:hypothetical protein